MFEQLKVMFRDFVGSELAGPALIGVLVTLLTTETHSWKQSVARIVCGFAAAIIFTDPTVDALNRDPGIYRDAIAALYAMTGFQLVRFLSSLNVQTILELWKSFRGK
jgi:hypothetical protein